MYRIEFLLGPILFSFLFISFAGAQIQDPAQQYRGQKRSNYISLFDDATLEVGARISPIFALDDRAPLSANPHFQAMWNLIYLGASLEAMVNGNEEPVNGIDLNEDFGKNGYNKTVFIFFVRYGWGESSSLDIQRHFVELALGNGYFKEGNGGMNVHLDYQFNFAKTNYGAGVQSIQRFVDYEIFVGGRIGFDWSFQRSESDAGFFATLQDEIARVAAEHDLTATQLLKLQSMAENSQVLLPKSVGGQAFHAGPLVGARISKQIFKSGRLFASAMGFYDLMDLAGSKGNRENQRSQHHVSLALGLSIMIGKQGEVLNFF